MNPKSKTTGRFDHEPTAEEVEAMIVEQMKNLPPWWDRDLANERRAQAQRERWERERGER